MALIGEYGYPIIDKGGYTRLVSDAGIFQDALELLQVRLAQDYLNLWAAIPENADPYEVRRFLVERLADLQILYGSDAAAIAAEFLNMSRDGVSMPLVVASPAPIEQVAGSVGWAMSKPETQALLWGAMQRMLNQPYRQTIQYSAFAAGNGFARVPDGKACAFCLMLASRGAVYYSREEALEIGLARWSTPGAKRKRRDREREAVLKGSKADYGYHDNCRCSVVEVSDNGGLTEANILLDRLWAESFYDDPGPFGDPSFRNKLKIDPETGLKIRPSLKRWEKIVKQANLPWMSTHQIYR